jgi:hypothetical protein
VVLQKHTDADETRHLEVLVAEGKMLAMIEYFLKSFHARAEAEGVKNLPSMISFYLLRYRN